ncbi:FMN-dependent NADH-azoreductase [Acidovorax sp. SUPP2539]|uniref:FMN-dependent NADH-azoreductase n=1 Tax=Acidovorax sp. SUPP2539 TaxID=2920878 RepID=UPI0023DE4070|nr:FMN-dependent NADH-azoreductase [Acidovorax sp. SUPP2539]GKS88274.1 FMN-dependent NADH-azoreductase [Acidovorax sp. SUPP2539]
MQILHIDSSILADASASRALTRSIVAELQREHPGAHVVYRDLVADPIAHLDGPIATGFRPLGGPSPSADVAAEHARSEVLVAELLASEVLVVGAPMYNFSVASQLKAWIDRVVQPLRTFRYTDKGPVGLTTGKRVLVASTRGGTYSAGPATAMDFQEDYLKAVLGFMGITDVRFVRAENLSRGSDARNASMDAAHAAVAQAVRPAAPL